MSPIPLLRTRRLLAVAALSFVLLVCGAAVGVGRAAAAAQPAAPQQTPEPTPGGSLFFPYLSDGRLPTIVPDTTVVLTGTTLADLIAVAPDASVLTFTQSITQPILFAPGDVLVSGPTEDAPDGLLRKVVSATEQEGQLVVQTAAATLAEAVTQAEISFSLPLAPADVRSAAYAEGVSLRAEAADAQAAVFYLDLSDVVVYDHDGNDATKGDQVTASGSIEVEPTFNGALRLRGAEFEHVLFTVTTRERAELKLASKLTLAAVKSEKELARYYLAPITIMAGPVPVVFTPIVTLVVGVDGEVYVSVGMKATSELTYTIGGRYAGGGWEAVAEETHSFGYEPPSVSAGGKLKGYVGPRFMILLYGVAGPQFWTDFYASLEADLFASPWWKLYAGVDASVAIRAEILGHKLAEFQAPGVIGVKVQLAQASTSAPGGRDRTEMVYIPAGSFPMGCNGGNGAESCQSDEQPVHTVNLSAFYIDKYEVTNARYKACVDDGACQPPSSNPRYGNANYADHPVVNVTRPHAEAFCAWAGKRLPTEAEWEKAAKGDDGRKYPWGNEAPDCNRLNYSGCKGDTTKVGSYPGGASPYGVMDMAGNVWEWVSDWYGADYYRTSPGTDPKGPAGGAFGVLRGGSWDGYGGGFVRASERDKMCPTAWYVATVGFRCARS